MPVDMQLDPCDEVLCTLIASSFDGSLANA